MLAMTVKNGLFEKAITQSSELLAAFYLTLWVVVCEVCSLTLCTVIYESLEPTHHGAPCSLCLFRFAFSFCFFVAMEREFLNF